MLLYFTISFYHYTILFYFTILLHPKILFLLKYYFLIFLYYFFITVIFFSDSFRRLSNLFFFPLLLPQPLATHKPSTTTATDQLKPPIHGIKNQTTDQLKPPINPSTTTATAPQPISTSTHQQP